MIHSCPPKRFFGNRFPPAPALGAFVLANGKKDMMVRVTRLSDLVVITPQPLILYPNAFSFGDGRCCYSWIPSNKILHDPSPHVLPPPLSVIVVSPPIPPPL